MADDTSPNHPNDLTDLPLQPTGSGVADMELARLQDELATGEGAKGGADADHVAEASVAAGIADESAAYDVAMRDEDRDLPTKTQV
jgi:hypothetical protein